MGHQTLPPNFQLMYNRQSMHTTWFMSSFEKTLFLHHCINFDYTVVDHLHLLTTWPPFLARLEWLHGESRTSGSPHYYKRCIELCATTSLNLFCGFDHFWLAVTRKGPMNLTPEFLRLNPPARKLNIMWAFQFISSYYENAVQIIKTQILSSNIPPPKTRTKYKTYKKRKNSSTEDKKKIVDELTLSLKKLFRIFITVYCTSKQINHYMI